MRRLTIWSLCCLLTSHSIYAADNATAESSKEKIQTYNVYSDINMFSAIKMRYGKNMYIKLVYPQLKSSTPDDYLETFNLYVTDLVEDQVNNFKQRVTDNAAQLANLPKDQLKNNLYVDYNTSVIKASEGDHVMGIRFTMQGMLAGTTQPYHYHRSLNYILETGESLELSDLFKPDVNYLEIFATFAREALARKHLPDPALLYKGTAPEANNYSIWNLRDRGILITFDNNQVAPNIYGPQTVLVPYSQFKGMVDSESIIFDCVTRRRSCATSNLLTGGFIDEASSQPLHGRLYPILSQR